MTNKFDDSQIDVSILMITYNHAFFIKRAIESVLSQCTVYSWELVIGDDASTDETVEIIQEYVALYPDKVRLLRSDINIGMIGNYERTRAECRGRYIAFLEGDDYWISVYKLQKQIDLLEADASLALVCSDIRSVNPYANEVISDSSPPQKRRLTTVDILQANYVATCTAVIRSHCLVRLPEDYRSLGLADWPLWFFASKLGDIYYIPEVLAVYSVHQSGAWSGAGILKRSSSIEMLFKHLKNHTKSIPALDRARWRGVQRQRYLFAMEAYKAKAYRVWWEQLKRALFARGRYFSPAYRLGPMAVWLPKWSKESLRFLGLF